MDRDDIASQGTPMPERSALLRELEACASVADGLSRELTALRGRLHALRSALAGTEFARPVAASIAPAVVDTRPAPAGLRPGTAVSAGVPQHLENWLERFTPAQLPVLERTCGEIALLRERQDRVDPQDIAAAIESDPMMTLKLYAHVAALRRRTQASQPDSVVGALLMLGVVPFFRAFEDLRSVEAQLQDRPDALEGLHSVLDRSFRAARFALAFSVHRMDPDAALLHSAALLHDVAELLLWCSEPDLAIAIRTRLRSRPGLRSAEAQRLVLHVRLIEVQHALMYRWRMPARLLSVLDGQKTENQNQVRTVELAVRIARHTALGWKDPAIPDDLIDIGRLLQLAPENVRKLVMDIDRE
jgi:HD-like signal output (HDOD) protein